MPPAPTLLWFRNDLRLADNLALKAAIEAGGPVIPVYIWAPEEAGNWSPGGATKWWLHQALEDLQAELVERGGGLVLRSGKSLEVLREIIAATGAERVVWNRRYESPLRELDVMIKQALRAEGLKVESFNSALLVEPHTVATQTGQPYKVYTPFFKSVKDRPVDAPADVNLEAMVFPSEVPASETLESLGLLPDIKWYEGMAAHWEPTESGAQKCLNRFLDKAASDYGVDRDRPDLDGTSSLSPYLHFGQIGPRQVIAALKAHCDLSQKGPFVFLKEIYWREFAYNVLYHFPETPDQPLQAKYADFPWEHDAELLRRWQKGLTGYPIIDAGMRQLYTTGWMHNRVRMIVASFLVKHLLQDWKAGARWFWDTLVDADLASNTLGWQWSGGCGADAAPYFRVFNPIIQGKKFDPEGDYVKRWVPELKCVPSKYIHAPWEMPTELMDAIGLYDGVAYPEPVIEHSAGRDRALAAFELFKEPVLAK
ncbi:MAG: deoxyribodipyrimidine photo-lyase [Verrucomicrobiota bacterium]